MMSQSMVLAKKPHIIIGKTKNQTVLSQSVILCISVYWIFCADVLLVTLNNGSGRFSVLIINVMM